MFHRVVLQLLYVLVGLATPGQASEVRALSVAEAIVGHTIHMDERVLRPRRVLWPEPQFVYFDNTGNAFIWFPGQNRTYRTNWRIQQERTVVRQDADGQFRVTTVNCTVMFPMSAKGQMKCESRTFQTDSTKERVYLHVRLCLSSGPEDSFLYSRNCRAVEQVQKIVLEERDGDVLDLRSGEVPCRLCRTHATFDDALRVAGKK